VVLMLSHAQSNPLGNMVVIIFQDMSRHGTLDICVLFCLIKNNNRTSFISDVGNNYA
jgi:hypothetical protein